MHYTIIAKVLGILLMLFSLTTLPPVLVSFYYDDGDFLGFVLAFLVTFGTGLIIWFPAKYAKGELRTRDGFVITAMFWTVLGSFAALPLIFSNTIDLSTTDALFEAMSGLTTTGATVIQGLDELPKSILYYRQQLQWLGGIGIVVIAIAILPMLGIGGMQLYKAETPGPIKDSKLTPRITQTAKALFTIYLILTLTCAFCYWLAGMSKFDAIGHAFTTTALGGFSTHDASMAYFNSNTVLLISMFFMILGGMNFGLHFISWNSKNPRVYLQDPECRFYLTMILLGCSVSALFLYLNNVYDLKHSFVLGSFQLVSILTTTGYGIGDYSIWPTFIPYFIFMFSFMGGCASSTGGGIKVIRVLLIIKQGLREIHRLIHPNAMIPVKVGNKTISDRVIEAVWGFFAVYLICFLIMVIMLLATGLDFNTAFSAVAACINNLGPGLGDVALHFGDISSPAKWTLCFAMLLGRLEVFTLLVLFTPMFWRS